MCIRQEHIRFGLSVKEIQGRIAFHVLAIWYILAKGVHHIIPIIKDMFHDLELEEECVDIIDKFPGVTANRDNTRAKNTPNQIQMGTKVLGKGQKSKSSTAASQSNSSSNNPLNPIRENGEMDMEEQMLELVDDTENNESSTSGDQQPLITFGQAQLPMWGPLLKIWVKV